jgi:DNA-binding transcriptional LysR family regulator
MKNNNILSLDGNILRTFLILLEESSVTLAAERLDLTQSAVSHALAKLRATIGDPLFVRSGQGLTPTETAISLKEPVLRILDELGSLSNQRSFDPLSEDMNFVIATNDLPRELIFPQLLHEARSKDIRLQLEFMPSGVPSVSLLREGKCQLILTPLPPDAPDVFQRPLFSSEMMCFYDGNERDAPKTWGEYITSEHIAVRFIGGHSSIEALRGADISGMPKATVSVSNFNAIPPFVKGSNLIATEINLMQQGPLKELSAAPLPFKSEIVTVFLVWHERNNNDPAHKWMRRRIMKISVEIMRKQRQISSIE